MDEETQREIRRKNLCFSCKEPWELAHRCMGKGKVNNIEVLPYSDGEEEARQAYGNKQSSSDDEKPCMEDKDVEKLCVEAKGGIIATISGVPRFHTFRICGVL
jgi:hypothetical protein